MTARRSPVVSSKIVVVAGKPAFPWLGTETTLIPIPPRFCFASARAGITRVVTSFDVKVVLRGA